MVWFIYKCQLRSKLISPVECLNVPGSAASVDVYYALDTLCVLCKEEDLMAEIFLKRSF